MVFAINSDESSAQSFSAFQSLAKQLNGSASTNSSSSASASASASAPTSDAAGLSPATRLVGTAFTLVLSAFALSFV